MEVAREFHNVYTRADDNRIHQSVDKLESDIFQIQELGIKSVTSKKITRARLTFQAPSDQQISNNKKQMQWIRTTALRSMESSSEERSNKTHLKQRDRPSFYRSKTQSFDWNKYKITEGKYHDKVKLKHSSPESSELHVMDDQIDFEISDSSSIPERIKKETLPSKTMEKAKQPSLDDQRLKNSIPSDRFSANGKNLATEENRIEKASQNTNRLKTKMAFYLADRYIHSTVANAETLKYIQMSSNAKKAYLYLKKYVSGIERKITSLKMEAKFKVTNSENQKEKIELEKKYEKKIINFNAKYSPVSDKFYAFFTALVINDCMKDYKTIKKKTNFNDLSDKMLWVKKIKEHQCHVETAISTSSTSQKNVRQTKKLHSAMKRVVNECNKKIIRLSIGERENIKEELEQDESKEISYK